MNNEKKNITVGNTNPDTTQKEWVKPELITVDADATESGLDSGLAEDPIAYYT